MSQLKDKSNFLIAAIAGIKTGLPEVQEMLKDKSLPLDERWEIYTSLVNNMVLVKIELYGDGFIETLGSDLTLYDDFNIEHHETTTYVEMYERIMQAEQQFDPDLFAAQKNITAWQEKCWH